MSWDSHINALMSGPKMKRAGLFGQAGSTWATSNGFSPTEAEVKQLVNLTKGSQYLGEKITVCGNKYIYRGPADDGMITVFGLGEEKTACTVCLTNTGVIIGESEASAAGQSREYLDKYKNYLKGINY